MPLFCKTCDNLLVMATTADSFHFKCNKCQKIETPLPNDTCIFTDVSGTNYNIYKAILLNAGSDPVNPKVYKKCPECSHHIIKQVRLGNEMKLINTCVKCSAQWLDGTHTSDN